MLRPFLFGRAALRIDGGLQKKSKDVAPFHALHCTLQRSNWQGKTSQKFKTLAGGIEPLHVSMPRELKSRPSTGPTHPGCIYKIVGVLLTMNLSCTLGMLLHTFGTKCIEVLCWPRLC